MPLARPPLLACLALAFLAAPSLFASGPAQPGRGFTRSYLRAARAYERTLAESQGEEAAQRFHTAMSEIARSGFLPVVGTAMEEQVRASASPCEPGARASRSPELGQIERLFRGRSTGQQEQQLRPFLASPDPEVRAYAEAVQAYFSAYAAYRRAVEAGDRAALSAAQQAYTTAYERALGMTANLR